MLVIDRNEKANFLLARTGRLSNREQMDAYAALLGHGQQKDARALALAALLRAVQVVTRLDERVRAHPLRNAWYRAEREIGMAHAVRAIRLHADVERIFAARIGAKGLPRGDIALGDLDARARRWNRIAQRKGERDLRALVARLVPSRGQGDLLGLAGQVAATLPQCAQAVWTVDVDARSGDRHLRSWSPASGHVDAADLALALPFALRRAGLCTVLLPGLVGRLRAFAREDGDTLAGLTLWSDALADQAREGLARLAVLESHSLAAERALGAVRRPAALRRVLALSLQNWSLWAAQLARASRVDISSAWRTLEQAAELGLVVKVPMERRTRGDGTLYAAPPWLRLAGLISVRRGRPAGSTLGNATEVQEALAELASALALTDRLLSG